MFAGAALVGCIHAAFSIYWAFGGGWLLETVGQFAVDMQDDGGPGTRLMLVAIGLAKAAGALVPLIGHLRPPAHRWVRVLSWIGAAILMVWGGVGMIGAWIGIVSGLGITDTPALAGHAFLWDPLFCAWAVFLIGALVMSRRVANGPVSDMGAGIQ